MWASAHSEAPCKSRELSVSLSNRSNIKRKVKAHLIARTQAFFGFDDGGQNENRLPHTAAER